MAGDATPDPRAPDPPEGLLARMVRFFTRRVWQVEIDKLPPARRGPVRMARVAYLAARGFTADQCLLRASALTYITVLSLVPLLAFSFSVLKGFGFYDRFIESTVTPFVEQTFGAYETEGANQAGVQGSVQMRQAIDYVLEFVQRTDVASLGILGLLLLIYTVLRLLSAIEHAFNDIWRVRRSRRLVRKLADYLAMVIVTPIFLLAATALTTAAQDNSVVGFLRQTLQLGPFIQVVLGLAPLLAMWLGFVFVFMALPNARTQLASAAIGALVSATLWQITLVLHLKFQIGIARYNAIYASFAAFPIFLMWINISWISVLLGAEVCAAHRSEPMYARMPHARSNEHAFRERLALRALTRIGQRFLQGEAPWTAERLARSLRVPRQYLDDVLAALVEGGILAVAGSEQDHAFLPARSLEAITIKDVLDALRGERGVTELLGSAAHDQPSDRILDALAEEVQSSRHNLTLKSLSESAARPTGPRQDGPATAAAPESADPEGDSNAVQSPSS